MIRKYVWIIIAIPFLVFIGVFIYDISSLLGTDHPVQELPGKKFNFKLTGIKKIDADTILFSFEDDFIEVVNPEEWKEAQSIYVSIIEDHGQARISTLSMYEPENADYIKASIKQISSTPPFILKIRYPFEKTSLKESSIHAEDFLTVQNAENIFVSVIIQNGQARAMDIFTAGKHAGP